MKMKKELNFAILGPGKISHRFVNGFQYTSGAKLFGVASRDINKAIEFAIQYKIPNTYGSYQDMLNDSNVDVVYIATPPFVHYEQVLMCLNAGKHVICEKPFVATKEELESLFSLAKEKNLFLMEAMKAVFIPTTKQVRKWLDEGRIGKVRYIQASYCYDGGFSDSHWVYEKEKMGGGMYDVGVYPAAYVNELMHSPIIDKKRFSILNNKGSDDFTEVVVCYENGVIASIRGAIRLQTENKAYIYGTEGKIIVDNFWKTNKAKLELYNGQEEIFEVVQNSEFTYQIQEVIDCVSAGKLESTVMSKDASLQLLEIVAP